MYLGYTSISKDMFYKFIFDVCIPLMKCYIVYIEQLLTKAINLTHFLAINLSIHREHFGAYYDPPLELSLWNYHYVLTYNTLWVICFLFFLFLRHFFFSHSEWKEISGPPRFHFLCSIIIKTFYYPLPFSVLKAINLLQTSNVKQGSML